MKKKGYRAGGKVKKMAKGGAAGGKKIRRFWKRTNQFFSTIV